MPRRKYKIPLNQIAKLLGISRQRVWQLVMVYEKRCPKCGGPTKGMFYCPKHIGEVKLRRNKLRTNYITTRDTELINAIGELIK